MSSSSAPGRWGAISMGARHGLYCASCCWVLMALAFVFGVMSLTWMAGLTAFLLLEKATPAGPWLGRVGGALLLVGAAWQALRPWVGPARLRGYTPAAADGHPR